MDARWIRMGLLEPIEFETAFTRLAAAQRADALPVLAWGQAERHYQFALVVPRRRAPGREDRWHAWGLSAAIATYRQFGYAATLDEGGISLYGRRIGEAAVRTVAHCVVVASTFLLRFPEACVITPSSALEQAFRLRLEAQHGWQFDHSWPTQLEEAHFPGRASTLPPA